MNKSAFFTTLLFIGIFMGNARATSLFEAKLLDISTSGSSLIVERGNLDDFSEGQFGRFYVQRGEKEFPKVFLVAEGELVKSFPKKSYWILKKVYIPGAIKKNDSLLMSTTGQMLQGRRPLKIKNQHVLASEKEFSDLDDYLDKNKDNVPARLVKESKAYEASADIFEEEELRDVNPDADVVVTTFENYKNKTGNYYSEEYGDLTEQRYYIGNREVVLGDIRKAEDKKVFDSMNDNYFLKTNRMKYGVTNFYAAEKKEDKKIVDRIVPRAKAKYKRDGDQWTSDMDDQALRRYFIETGIASEARRRELALSELEGHEVMFHYSGSMVSHGNTEDPNYQGRGYNLGIAYDLHLARTSVNLKKWSVQLLLEQGVTEYDTGVFNARSEETSYGAYLNYYFINNPLTLNSFIYLVGVGLKYGSASVFTPDFSKEYSYQVLTMPALQLMTKYRFRPGDLKEDTLNFGASANFGVSLDMKNLSVIDRLDDNIDSKISVTDLKYTLGMSLYF